MDDLASTSSISDFLNREGGLAILIQIDTDKGTLHNDFNDDVHVSRATVTNRIEEAKKLDLIMQTRHAGDHGNAKRYKLTQMGRVLRVALESMNLDETYNQYLKLQREIQQSTETMTDWLEDLTESLDNDIWVQKAITGEFDFNDELKDQTIYPGKNVTDDFVQFIDGGPSIDDEQQRAVERIEQGIDDPYGSDSDDSSE